MFSSRLSPRRLLNTLVALAILAQAAVPMGFMPDFHAKAGISIKICTAGGLASVFVPGEKTPTKTRAAHESCPYAPLLAQGLAPPAAQVLPPVPPMAAPRPIAVFAFIFPVPKPWYAQGPPA